MTLSITHDARTLDRGVARAVAIGNFDGVHRGHARLVECTLASARALGLEPCVLTFSPHPARVLAPDRAPPLLMPEARRFELLRTLGAERVIVQPFDAALAALTPRVFAEMLLRDAVNARAVCVGYDFTFGHKRSGTTEMLEGLGAELGFATNVVPAVRVGGVVCASTTIRGLVGAGSTADARALLGRPVEVEGIVVHGDARGRTIGFPTINIAVENEVVPAGGVYAGWAELPEGTRVRAAINVGTNPTFTTSSERRVEAYLLDWSGDLYGARVRLLFDLRLRTELRFDGVAALVAQMNADVAATRALVVPPLPPTD